MSQMAKLLAKAVDPERYKTDPENPNWTTPKTWGTFSVSDENKFRLGNYPVRMDELRDEFGGVELIALFENRDDAETLAGMLKNL